MVTAGIVEEHRAMLAVHDINTAPLISGRDKDTWYLCYEVVTVAVVGLSWYT